MDSIWYVTSTQIGTDLRTGDRHLAQFFTEQHIPHLEDANYYSIAKFVTFEKYSGISRLQPYNVLGSGSVFSIFTIDFNRNIVAAATTHKQRHWFSSAL